MWLTAPNINCTHGFSTRWGGVSKAPFNELNLGGSDDNQNLILENRKIALQKLNYSLNELSNLKQVHGTQVCLAKASTQQEGDALVTNQKGVVLAVSIADCYPILFYDEKNKVIGAAHCGWRGTLGRLAKKTILKMLELGSDITEIKVAIGQGISQKNFEVGQEVIEQFKNANFPEYCWKNRNIDLIACIKFVLLETGLSEKNMWSMNRCTFEDDFFSYRQDKGLTGRMWAVIGL